MIHLPLYQKVIILLFTRIPVTTDQIRTFIAITLILHLASSESALPTGYMRHRSLDVHVYIKASSHFAYARFRY